MFFWKNIYGAPTSYSGKHCDLMNKEPNSASYWKGRVLMHVQAQETDKPKLLMRTIQDEQLIKDSENHLKDNIYVVNCQAIAGMNMPEQREEYKLQIRIADNEFETKQDPTFNTKKKQDNSKGGGYCRWMEQIADNK